MSYLGVQDRFQIQMRSMEEFIDKENAVRFVDAFVEQLVHWTATFAKSVFCPFILSVVVALLLFLWVCVLEKHKCLNKIVDYFSRFNIICKSFELINWLYWKTIS